MTSRSAIRPTQLYDALVLGSQLPGLVAGALLAKRGLRVLHAAPPPPAPRVEAGFLFPEGDGLLPPLRAVPSLHSLFEELGVLPAMVRAFQPVPGGLQLVLPSARLRLPSQPEARKRELLRAFGESGSELERSLDEARRQGEEAASLLADRPPLPPVGLLERIRLSRFARKLRGRLPRLPFDPGSPFGSALRDLHAFTSPQAGDPPPVAFLRSTLPILLEPAQLEGESLKEVLRRSIEGHRGDVLGSSGEPANVEELILERGRFSGIRLAGLQDPHRARICLIADDTDSLLPLLPESRIRRRFERSLEERPPVRERLASMELVIAEEGIPPGMAERVLISGFAPSPVFLRIEPTLRADGQPAEGLRTITASTVGRAGEGEEAAEAKLLGVLEEVMPFHDRHLRHRGRATFRLPRHAPPVEEATGLEGGGIRSTIPRLLLADSSVLPGLGLEGAVLTGLRVARLAEEAIQKVRPG